MAVKTFLLPDLGEGLTEAELVNWLVAVGDTVAVDQPIAEVETAKSMVEVPSPFAGTVHELFGAAGDTMDVGKPLISVEDGSGATGGAPSGNGSAPAETAQSYREEERAGAQPPAVPVEEPAESGSGNVLIGYGTPGGSGSSARKRRPKARPGASVGPAAPAVPAAPVAGPARRAPLVVNPLVRRLAREHGVDLGSLAGSGPDGLILRADVQAALDGAAAPGAPAGSPAAPAAGAVPSGALSSGTPAGPGARLGSGVVPSGAERDAKSGLGIAARTPVKGVRKTIAAAMTRSRAEIPEATVWVDVDATELLRLRAGLKKADPHGTPGLLAFIARFALAGLARHPELNTRVETAADGSQEIVSFDGVNLGFAAQTDRGLMVPSIRDAHTLSARGIDAELKRLTALARDGKASPQDLTSGTFTLNNYGVFGVDGSAAIINYPEAAILGVGRIIDKPWVVDGQLAVRKVTELTLTFDHRVCDGGTAGGFLRFVADAIENPAGLLAEL
ncbi:dihydrolipoamide acetyltransferase family protein [Zafaria sp. J156]|uniref:dihydrolipoamide acetyltransferase family protein n=1 Tax=Zafaria sp. J156 TaxID=3116490 RepID=UPI002E7927A9|nr:dihydrolipoamide acetyltransferase family protein [Zafaria sp. J156]MEE1621265.1 dihydrolipoamide acetyltransferase family protein [Zafaria sp. J156]